MGPGKGRLSLSPVRRSPDLQARSTSFSKSVCKAETGQSEPEGERAGAALELQPHLGVARVMPCARARTLLRAEGAHGPTCSPTAKPRVPVRRVCTAVGV